MSDSIAQAADLIERARYRVAFTGAGISTPSGVPDFRSSATGLWSQVDPMEVASLYAFRRNPDAFYEWIRPLAQLLMTAQPNAAHFAIAHLEQAGYLQAVITQNIDLLHSRAGSQQIYEVHGHIREATCVQCYAAHPAQPILAKLCADGVVPDCPACGGLLKPNVILFGEQLPMTTIIAAQRAARRCDLMLVAGSSLEVYPAAELPEMALASGARLIIVNREPTHLDHAAAVVIHADVAEVLPAVTAMVLGSLQA